VDVDRVQKAFETGTLISWAKLFNEKEYQSASLELYYQESYLVAKFLVDRWGWKKMTALLTRLGEGYPLEDALRAEYKEEIPLLEKEWHRWFRMKYT
jgi:hypothetical protein